MKKIFTLLTIFAVALTAKAQNALEFCYQDGTIVPSGSEIVVDTPNEEELEWGEYMFNSGLYIKNTTSSAVSAELTFSYATQEMGELSVCLGTNCRMFNGVGNATISNQMLAAGSVNDMQCHWSPEWNEEENQNYGTCDAEFTLKAGGETCSTIKLKFVYADPSAIQNVQNGSKTVVATFGVNGQRLSDNAHGIVIEKLSDGSVVKTIK